MALLPKIVRPILNKEVYNALLELCLKHFTGRETDILPYNHGLSFNKIKTTSVIASLIEH